MCQCESLLWGQFCKEEILPIESAEVPECFETRTSTTQPSAHINETKVRDSRDDAVASARHVTVVLQEGPKEKQSPSINEAKVRDSRDDGAASARHFTVVLQQEDPEEKQKENRSTFSVRKTVTHTSLGRPAAHTSVYSEAGGLLFDPEGGLRSSELVVVFGCAGDFAKNFDVFGEELGRGAFGVVRRVRRKRDGRNFAMKLVKQGELDDARFEREFAISKKLVHPNIVGLHELYRERTGELLLIMDLCSGENLCKRVQSTIMTVYDVTIGGFTTHLVNTYALQMLYSIAYLHRYRFAHRDIKLDNYMFETAKETAPLKLIDFGLARRFEKGEPMLSRVGTPSYAAPELFAPLPAGYNERVDIWSLGVCLFIMSCGNTPFGLEHTEDLVRLVKEGQPEFEKDRWSNHPRELQDLIVRMLSKSGSDRPSAKQLINDPWFSRSSAGCCAMS